MGGFKDKSATIHVRVNPVIKMRAQKRAERSGTTLSAVLRWQLGMYAAAKQLRWTRLNSQTDWWERLAEIVEQDDAA